VGEDGKRSSQANEPHNNNIRMHNEPEKIINHYTCMVVMVDNDVNDVKIYLFEYSCFCDHWRIIHENINWTMTSSKAC